MSIFLGGRAECYRQELIRFNSCLTGGESVRCPDSNDAGTRRPCIKHGKRDELSKLLSWTFAPLSNVYQCTGWKRRPSGDACHGDSQPLHQPYKKDFCQKKSQDLTECCSNESMIRRDRCSGIFPKSSISHLRTYQREVIASYICCTYFLKCLCAGGRRDQIGNERVTGKHGELHQSSEYLSYW